MTRVLRKNPHNAVKLGVCAALVVITSVAVQTADEQPVSALGCQLSITRIVTADDPHLAGSSVNSSGRVVQLPSWYCFVQYVWVRGQTKVCGFWGCNWHTKRYLGDDGRTSDWSGSVSQDCRTGLHRYRTLAGIDFRTVSIGRAGISVSSYHSKPTPSAGEPQFLCRP